MSGEAERLLAALPGDVARAVRDCVPTGPGNRNRSIHRLARYMAGMFPGVEAGDLEHVVRAWHALSLPHMGTTDFDESFGDFAVALPGVKHPLKVGGGDAINAAADRAWGAADPPEAAAVDSAGARFLLRLIRELSPRWPGGAVPLPQSVAVGQLRRVGIDVDDKTAGRWLASLRARKLIRVAEEHTATRGRRWVYLLDDAATPGAGGGEPHPNTDRTI